MYACVRVFGVRCCGLAESDEGIGCVILECSEEVRLGMKRLLSAWSRVTGRASRSLVRGRVKEACAVSEGAMFAVPKSVFRTQVQNRASDSQDQVSLVSVYPNR